jgi:hypothetical protein
MKIKTTKRFYRITSEMRDDGVTPIYWQASRSVPGWDAYCKTRSYGVIFDTSQQKPKSRVKMVYEIL